MTEIGERAATTRLVPGSDAARRSPQCEYWSRNHSIAYRGPDSKFVTSTQISAVDIAFTLEANLAGGNITVTSLFTWGTLAAGITADEKRRTIARFKARAAGWSGHARLKISDPVCGVRTLPIRFRLLWAPDDRRGPAPFRVNLHRTYPRAGVTGWDIDIAYNSSVSANSGWTLAHEYGHTLCLPDEYFYAGVTSATVTYKKANGSTEAIRLEPRTANMMFRSRSWVFRNRFFYFVAVEAQELLRTQSGRNVVCEIV